MASNTGPVIFSPSPGQAYPVDVGGQESFHVYDQSSIDAVQAAFNAQRPLLIRGEPGIGKSQLAYAAADFLKWPILPFTVTASAESTDLLWHYDAIARLAEAQVKSGDDPIKHRLAFKRFIKPGVLWWAFDWNGAESQAGGYLIESAPATGSHQSGSGIDCVKQAAAAYAHPEKWSPGQGCVVLIDEIDKADSDLPNSLLEALGNWQFTVPYLPRGENCVAFRGETRPLVMITTNNERQLPPAFVRRCLVLDLALPRERNELIARFREYARAHFAEKSKEYAADDWGRITGGAAGAVCDDREIARTKRIPAPSVAEYIDLLRAILNDPKRKPLDLLPIMGRFILGKHNPETD
jgi:MoxR-like ATPase